MVSRAELNLMTPFDPPGRLRVAPGASSLSFASYLDLAQADTAVRSLALCLTSISPTLTLLNLCGYTVDYLVMAPKTNKVDTDDLFCVINLTDRETGVGSLKGVRAFRWMSPPESVKASWFLAISLAPVMTAVGTAALDLSQRGLIETSASPMEGGWLYLPMDVKSGVNPLNALGTALAALGPLNARLLALLASVQLRSPVDNTRTAANGLLWLYHPSMWKLNDRWRKEGVSKVAEIVWSFLERLSVRDRISFLATEVSLDHSSAGPKDYLVRIEKLASALLKGSPIDLTQVASVTLKARTPRSPAANQKPWQSWFTEADRRGFETYLTTVLRSTNRKGAVRPFAESTFTEVLMQISNFLGFVRSIRTESKLRPWNPTSDSTVSPAIVLAAQLFRFDSEISSQFSGDILKGLQLLRKAIHGVRDEEYPATVSLTELKRAELLLSSEAAKGSQGWVNLNYTRKLVIRLEALEEEMAYEALLQTVVIDGVVYDLRQESAQKALAGKAFNTTLSCLKVVTELVKAGEKVPKLDELAGSLQQFGDPDVSSAAKQLSGISKGQLLDALVQILTLMKSKEQLLLTDSSWLQTTKAIHSTVISSVKLTYFVASNSPSVVRNTRFAGVSRSVAELIGKDVVQDAVMEGLRRKLIVLEVIVKSGAAIDTLYDKEATQEKKLRSLLEMIEASAKSAASLMKGTALARGAIAASATAIGFYAGFALATLSVYALVLPALFPADTMVYLHYSTARAGVKDGLRGAHASLLSLREQLNIADRRRTESEFGLGFVSVIKNRLAPQIRVTLEMIARLVDPMPRPGESFGGPLWIHLYLKKSLDESRELSMRTDSYSLAQACTLMADKLTQIIVDPSTAYNSLSEKDKKLVVSGRRS